ncbi:hypothetical protein ACFQXB_11720 [Plastorhodobacter daqingensis]|uniref:Uncharacterized protein n=1 Tax=Plastorhodobacter daqingensis TaxID=1387281 RepID=A0ABW2UMZ2_9RHOB
MRETIAAKVEPTFRADIFIGGSVDAAREACREFVMRGLCVSMSPCDFIYTGGVESGVRIGLINYPRFPKSPTEITEDALELARFLIVRLHQSSASVVTDSNTTWLTRREVD